MAAATEYLSKQPRVRLLGAVQRITEGPSAGYEWQAFEAPWGLALEIVSRPERLPYEEATTARFFGPAASWEADVGPPFTRAGSR